MITAVAAIASKKVLIHVAATDCQSIRLPLLDTGIDAILTWARRAAPTGLPKVKERFDESYQRAAEDIEVLTGLKVS